MIKSGHYRQGEKIPSIRSLSETFHCNKNAVIRALAELERKWCYIKKVDTKTIYILQLITHDKRKFTTSIPKYDDDFKKSIVTLYQNGKTQTQLSKEYGGSISAIVRWIKQYSEVKLDDNSILSAKQIKELEKRNAMLEEENLILKKAIAIFTPHSNKD